MSGRQLAIAVDLGTTYTGVAIGESSNDRSRSKQIHVVTNWPACHTKIGTKEKVPTEIAYLDGGKKYGSDIPVHAPRYMWMKLQLDRHQPGQAAKILSELSYGGTNNRRRPTDIIADFLALVKEHLLQNLDEQYGKELWRTLPIVLVVTVPAVWSDLAKSRTMQAFDKAGFNKKQFPQLAQTITTTEPEAAAIFTIKTLRGSALGEQFSVGDGLIVCDMGGGTVDLISYKVAGLQPTVVEEATVGNGDQCGATFVDRAFIQWLEDTLGIVDFLKIAGCRAKDVAYTSMSQKLGRLVSDFVLEAKTGYSGKEHNFLRLPPPLSALEDDETRGICEGEIAITPSALAAMFKDCIDKTCELLEEQLEQARRYGDVDIKYIFLVGGFAESPYVYSQLKAFGDSVGLTVFRPAYSWSAVVRGAAAKGLEIDGESLVKNRKCRRYYGTSSCNIFIRGLHSEADAFICPFTDTKCVPGMSWLLKKGQTLSTAATAHTKWLFTRRFWSGEKRKEILSLLASSEDTAPQHKSHWSVYEVARLIVDLSDVPDTEFKASHSRDGRLYYKLSYELQISVQSALEYSLWVNGKRYGTLTANYEA